jgi:hypothetical protein
MDDPRIPAGLQPGVIVHGVVSGVDEQRGVAVVACAGLAETLDCEVLAEDGQMLALAPGDRVVVIPPGDRGQHGVVLGRIGRCRLRADDAPAASLSEEVVIEAARQLVLKCGAASITIRGDGKVLIKGTDVVSRAQRSNRIKGGSVAIN